MLFYSLFKLVRKIMFAVINLWAGILLYLLYKKVKK